MTSPTIVPVVNYLSIDESGPHLECAACSACGARYFGRRNACASCGGQDFHTVALSTTGRVEAYSIVHVAQPGIPVPFIAVMVNCDGVLVKANLVGVDPIPTAVETGMRVRLVTFEFGVDAGGCSAVGFAFALEEFDNA
jgi:uncharacterized OB-fold protein